MVGKAMRSYLDQADADLDALLGSLVDSVARGFGGGKPNVPAIRSAVEDRVFELFGAAASEAPYSAFGRYLEESLPIARAVGFEGSLPTPLDWLATSEGKTLSESTYAAGQEILRMVNAQIDDFVARKVDPLDGLNYLRDFLTIDGAEATKGVGSGGKGLYPARRVLYTEAVKQQAIGTMARSMVEAASAFPPRPALVRWVLDPSHRIVDDCDTNARRNIGYGAGVYPVDRLPKYPSHPHEKCHIEAVRV